MTNLTVGDARKFGAKFFDLSGDLADPDTVIFEVKHPGGEVDIYSGANITKVSTGIYSKVILLDSQGEWTIEWQGTGAIQKVANSSFYVKPQKIVPE